MPALPARPPDRPELSPLRPLPSAQLPQHHPVAVDVGLGGHALPAKHLRSNPRPRASHINGVPHIVGLQNLGQAHIPNLDISTIGKHLVVLPSAQKVSDTDECRPIPLHYGNALRWS